MIAPWLLGPAEGANICARYLFIKTRCVGFSPKPRKIQNGPKRRATSIVARPGSSCKSRIELLDFDGCDAFKFLLYRLSLVFRRGFLQRLGGAIDQVLSFLQAERGDLADSLNGVDLVRSGILEDDLEFGLFLSRRSRCSTAAAGNCDRSSCCRRNAETLFKLLHQGRRFEQAQANNLFFQLCEIRHVFSPFNPFEIDIPGRKPKR